MPTFQASVVKPTMMFSLTALEEFTSSIVACFIWSGICLQDDARNAWQHDTKTMMMTKKKRHFLTNADFVWSNMCTDAEVTSQAVIAIVGCRQWSSHPLPEMVRRARAVVSFPINCTYRIPISPDPYQENVNIVNEVRASNITIASYPSWKWSQYSRRFAVYGLRFTVRIRVSYILYLNVEFILILYSLFFIVCNSLLTGSDSSLFYSFFFKWTAITILQSRCYE